MKTTHWMRSEVTAWRYQPNAPIPVWVAQKFHNIGKGATRTARIGDTLVDVEPGQWIVANESSAGVEYIVLTDDDFKKSFTLIEV